MLGVPYYELYDYRLNNSPVFNIFRVGEGQGAQFNLFNGPFKKRERKNKKKYTRWWQQRRCASDWLFGMCLSAERH